MVTNMNTTETSQISTVRMDTTRPSGNRTPAATPQQTGEGRDTTDRITLTQEARRVLDLQAEFSNLPDIDVEKVAELRARIEAGDYSIDTGAIADGLISMQQDLKS